LRKEPAAGDPEGGTVGVDSVTAICGHPTRKLGQLGQVGELGASETRPAAHAAIATGHADAGGQIADLFGGTWDSS